MGILEKLFFILITVVLPLSEVARLPVNEITITLLDLFVAVVVTLWIFLRKKIPRSDLKKPILIFMGVLSVTLILNIPRLSVREVLVSSLYLIRWVFYSILFFAVLDLTNLKKKINKAMIIGGGIIVVLGYLQLFLYSDLRNLFYAGWDEHLYRMFTWTFFDPNFAGSFFVLYLIFISSFIKVKRKIIFILPAITLIAIFFTFSRSAYIAGTAGTLVYLFILKQKKKFILTFLILLAFSVFALLKISPKSEGTNLLRTASGIARLDSAKSALAIIKDHPFLGVGFNSYRYAKRDYGFVNENKMIIHSGAGTDNSFLFILATSGILGLITFIYLLLKMILIKDPVVVSSILAIVINSFFINALFYPPIMLWIWILLGIRRST